MEETGIELIVSLHLEFKHQNYLIRKEFAHLRYHLAFQRRIGRSDQLIDSFRSPVPLFYNSEAVSGSSRRRNITHEGGGRVVTQIHFLPRLQILQL